MLVSSTAALIKFCWYFDTSFFNFLASGSLIQYTRSLSRHQNGLMAFFAVFIFNKSKKLFEKLCQLCYLLAKVWFCQCRHQCFFIQVKPSEDTALLKGDGDIVFTWVNVTMEVFIVHTQYLSFFLQSFMSRCILAFLFNVLLEKLLFDWVTTERGYW